MFGTNGEGRNGSVGCCWENEITSSFPFLVLNICVDHIRQVKNAALERLMQLSRAWPWS